MSNATHRHGEERQAPQHCHVQCAARRALPAYIPQQFVGMTKANDGRLIVLLASGKSYISNKKLTRWKLIKL